MSKKKPKSKDLKKAVLNETPEYQLITLEENHVYQIKHENLIQRVRNSTVLLADVEMGVKEQEDKENLKKEWQAYLSCDKIPKPFEPQSIRDFFDKSHYFEAEDVENTINWMLAIDECSILNQDINSQNLTKSVLKNYRIDFGQQYDIRICDTMELLRRIESFLKSENKQVSRSLLHDIKELKQTAINKIYHCIDNLSYRVLSSETAYMEPIDVTTAEYSFGGKYFDIHIWTFQNVPLNLDPDEIKSKSIDLLQIKTNLVVPFSVLSENMVIRGLHCQFDPFSPLTRYYELPKSMDDEIERSLKICLQKEWSSQLKLQAEIKENMIKERAEYEEAMRLKAEEEELKAKEAKKDEKPKKSPSKNKENPVNLKKFSREPPIVTPDLVPVVRSDFLEHDSQDYSNAIIKYHPHKLTLSKDEINLRQYQILGGVYHINSLSKPKTTNLPKLIMSWYNNDKNVETKNLEIHSDPPESDDNSMFFEISFELPDCFCHWSDPIACFFEEHGPVADNRELIESTRSLKIGSPIIVNDFNLQDLFTESMMYDFLEASIPRVISSFQFPEDFYDEDAEKKKNKDKLGRTKANTVENEKTNNELQKQLLSFDVQNSPERLFPLFKNVLPVVVLPINVDNQTLGDHKYFSEFLSTLESIKDSYRKSTFKDSSGKPVKISAEEYGRSVGRPRITTKLAVYGEAGEARSSLNKSEQASVGTRHSLDHQPELTTRNGQPNLKEDISSNQSMKSIDSKGKEEELVSKWSTSNVLRSVFNRNEKKVTIFTDRLGTFGFAFNRYEHLPFKSWSLQPNEENSDELELELKIESKHALFKIFVARDGYRAFVTDFSKTIKNRKVFLEITEPISNIGVFKEKLQEKFLNIFPEVDAVWYVEGDFSQKHLSAELHTYDCISLNAFALKFQSSDWNKLSDRRTMVLALGELRRLEQEECLVRITPEEVMFVEIKQTNNNMGVMELEFVSTWRNLEWYADLNQLIKSNFDDTSDLKLSDQDFVVFHLRNLLHSLRLFSFS